MTPNRVDVTPDEIRAGPRVEAAEDEERLSLSTIVVYSVPHLGVGATFFVIGMYFMKYATDVLLIAPATIGLLFGISRIWDALSDPVAGYLSDRTKARIGRRRAWMLASVVPLILSTVMLWSPPGVLTGNALIAWVCFALLACYTAVTVFSIPHEALGAELTTRYHERTRIFGLRHVVGMGGFLFGVLALWLLETAPDKRSTALLLALVGSLATGLLILFAVWRLRERPEYQGRGGTSLKRALRDVYANPHARLLLVVFFIENIGSAVLMVLLPFFTAYILRAEGMSAIFLLLYAGPSIALVPVWLRLARRFGKKNLWLFSMSLLTVAFSGMFFVGETDVELLYLLALLAGVGGGCGSVVGPSIQADVIDWDELRTGERKEGSYFAVWNFVRKSATGVTAMVAGFALQLTGFVPNAEQTEGARLAIRGLMGLFPGTCYLIGTLLFLRFTLNQAEHRTIRSELDSRQRD